MADHSLRRSGTSSSLMNARVPKPGHGNSVPGFFFQVFDLRSSGTANTALARAIRSPAATM